MSSLTIFFPCYNDAGTIGSLVAAADTVAAEFTGDYEIIVVDDGSGDSSRELLRSLQGRYPRLRLVFHDQNRGYGAALRSGFAHATKDVVFYTDGSARTPPSSGTTRASRRPWPSRNGGRVSGSS